jgi:hypothetical protein
MSSQDTEPLVYVEWADSSGHDGWAPRNDLADHARPSTCRTSPSPPARPCSRPAQHEDRDDG